MEVQKLTTKKRLTQADKDYLLAEGEKYGIEPPTNTKCPDCWRDMAIRITVAMRPKVKGTRLRGNAARDGVVFKGRLITNPIDAETLAWMRDNNFPEQLLTDAED